MCVAALALCVANLRANAQTKTTPPSKQTTTEQVSRITIEVSGGEAETPVENASIYIKYIEERKVKKDKLTGAERENQQRGHGARSRCTDGKSFGASGCRWMEDVWALVRCHGCEADDQDSPGQAAQMVLKGGKVCTG